MLVITQAANNNTYFYCPDSSLFVQLGDSPQQVESTCGTPQSVKMVNQDNNLNQQPLVTRWVYNKINNLVTKNQLLNLSSDILEVDFQNNQIITITINGQAVGDTDFCQMGRTIEVGDTANDVLKSCGYPKYQQIVPINNTNNTNNPNNHPEQLIIYTYQNRMGDISHLTFQDFKLIQIDN